MILTQGYVARVDDADYLRVSAYKWCAQVLYRKNGSIRAIYAIRTVRKADGKWTTELLHRFILNVTDQKIQIDHRDHDGLHNERHNLRVATRAQNNHNGRLQPRNTSGFRGVSFDRRAGNWKACISVGGKNKHLGTFATAEGAARAYDAAAIELYGAFACTNVMLGLLSPEVQLPQRGETLTLFACGGAAQRIFQPAQGEQQQWV